MSTALWGLIIILAVLWVLHKYGDPQGKERL